ncbi:hypothetical protein SynM161_01815 [Synechococcus sp. M16.1]|nr:hypothetical protein SynM161_01815 [Synechococcus sp. M16.1]
MNKEKFLYSLLEQQQLSELAQLHRKRTIKKELLMQQQL